MASVSPSTRLNQVPVLHFRGSHFLLGYTIGRQFRHLVEQVLVSWKYFNEVVVERYLTPEGKALYDGCLALVSAQWPEYVAELRGMAQGAGLPFYKLFLLHVDTLLVDPELEDAQYGATGCTTLLSNAPDTGVLVGHTEDACPEFLNNVFIVHAEILDESGGTREKWASLTYAGYLPGYTMGWNAHGMVYTVNTLFPRRTLPSRTPRNFLARALLRSRHLEEALHILRNPGTGVADGFSVNLHFAREEGTPLLHNVEVGPNPALEGESDLSVLTLTQGETHAHCNKYLRLRSIPELEGVAMQSSTRRHKALGRHLPPHTLDRMKEQLSDESDTLYPVFRRGNDEDYVKTVVVGVFEVEKRRWSLYVEPPATSAPVAVLHLDF